MQTLWSKFLKQFTSNWEDFNPCVGYMKKSNAEMECSVCSMPGLIFYKEQSTKSIYKNVFYRKQSSTQNEASNASK